MTILLAICGLTVCGILRHLQGGLDKALGLHRWQIYVGYALLIIPAAVVYWGSSWFGIPYLGSLRAVLLLAILEATMICHERADNPWFVLWRQSVAPLALAIITGWWWALLCGPILAIGTVLLARVKDRVPIRKPWLDGWGAYLEIMTGAANGLIFVLAPILGTP
jgi:hypothetical protein